MGAIAGFFSNVFVSICGFPSLTNKESAIPCRKNDIVSHFFCFHYLMEKKRGTKAKPPRQRYSPPLSKLYPAISPRRRLDLEFGKPNSGAARERSSHAQDGTRSVSTWTCTNYIQAHPLIKVLRSFFKSDRSPRSPRSPPVTQRLHNANVSFPEDMSASTRRTDRGAPRV